MYARHSARPASGGSSSGHSSPRSGAKRSFSRSGSSSHASSHSSAGSSHPRAGGFSSSRPAHAPRTGGFSSPRPAGGSGFSRGGSSGGPRKSFGGSRGGGRSGGGSRGGGRGFRGERIDFSRFVKKAEKVEEKAYVPIHKFADFPFSDQLKKNIAKKGFVYPTPIQDQSILPIIEGRDFFGLANTGTGKTGAFILPLIDRVYKDKKQKVLIIGTEGDLFCIIFKYKKFEKV